MAISRTPAPADPGPTAHTLNRAAARPPYPPPPVSFSDRALRARVTRYARCERHHPLEGRPGALRGRARPPACQVLVVVADMLGRCGLRWLRPARCGAGRGPHPRFCGPVHQIAAARLAPARISIAAAAARVIDVSGMAFSKPLRTAIAIVATDHSASTDPIPTATGSWYLAARPAVRIWVRSPNSATRITVKLVAATPEPRTAPLTPM